MSENKEKEKIYKYLDENIGFGSGCSFEDYDDKDAILDFAVEIIEERDDFTLGCGVGPLMRHIESWVEEFKKESQKKQEDILEELENKANPIKRKM